MDASKPESQKPKPKPKPLSSDLSRPFNPGDLITELINVRKVVVALELENRDRFEKLVTSQTNNIEIFKLLDGRIQELHTQVQEWTTLMKDYLRRLEALEKLIDYDGPTRVVDSVENISTPAEGAGRTDSNERIPPTVLQTPPQRPGPTTTVPASARDRDGVRRASQTQPNSKKLPVTTTDSVPVNPPKRGRVRYVRHPRPGN